MLHTIALSSTTSNTSTVYHPPFFYLFLHRSILHFRIISKIFSTPSIKCSISVEVSVQSNSSGTNKIEAEPKQAWENKQATQNYLTLINNFLLCVQEFVLGDHHVSVPLERRLHSTTALSLQHPWTAKPQSLHLKPWRIRPHNWKYSTHRG